MKINNSFNQLCKDINKSQKKSLLPLENVKNQLPTLIGYDRSKFMNIYIECISFNPNTYDNQITSLINIFLAILTVTLTGLLSVNNFMATHFVSQYPMYVLLIFKVCILFFTYLCYVLIRRSLANYYMLKWHNYVLYSLQCYAKDRNWDIPKDFTV